VTTYASLHASVLRHLLHASLVGDRASVADLVTDDVVAWSPNMFVTSRDQLLNALERQEAAFSSVEVSVHALDELGDKAFAEWHLSADHTGPLAVDDDLVLQPTDRRVHLSGATFAEFDGDRICAFRTYFDDLALLEQALVDE
jgi:ketosteroid isomerase-like protein